MFSKLIVLVWLCCNSLACIKPLLSQKDLSTEKISNHQRLGFRFERIPEGILVIEVVNGMGAAVSGLQPGDIILTANGDSGEQLVSVLQDRSQEYVQLEVQPRWSSARRILVVQRGIGSGIESPTVDPLLKLAATGNLTDAKTLFQTGSYKLEDVVTALRLIERNYPQKHALWLNAVQELVPLNTIILQALMRGYNTQHDFTNAIALHDEWQDTIGWDVWTQYGPVYTHANLDIERELLRALMQSGQQERAIEQLRELQLWQTDTGLESIVGMAPDLDVQTIWSDKGAPFARISGIDARGEHWSIEDKPWTVLAFWATWCAPCKKELPELNAWVKSRSDVSVLAVNVDDNLESKGVLKALQKLDASSLRGLRSAQLMNIVGVEAIPTIVLIDENGVERYRMIGYSPTTIAEMESKMTEIVPRIQLAQTKDMNVDWYPKSSLKDVLYDGRLWWLLDEQRFKSVSSLVEWLQGTEQESINTDEMSEKNNAHRLMWVGEHIATTYNQGKILRFPKNSGLPVLSAAEPIDNVYVSERKIWGWGNSTLEVIKLEQELQNDHLQHNTVFNVPIQHLDDVPFYSDDTLLEFANTERPNFPSIDVGILRWNTRTLSTEALLGHHTVDFVQTNGVHWFLRSHTQFTKNPSYSLIALDASNNLLGTLSLRSSEKPRIVSDNHRDISLMNGQDVMENGQSLWVVIPDQGLMHIQIANLHPPTIDRRQ